VHLIFNSLVKIKHSATNPMRFYDGYGYGSAPLERNADDLIFIWNLNSRYCSWKLFDVWSATYKVFHLYPPTNSLGGITIIAS
jgi:hypothetical protein